MVGKMFTIPGNKKIDFGSQGTFQEPVVFLIRRERQALIWNGHLRNLFQPF